MDRLEVKRPNFEEHQIMRTTLHEYLELEHRFKEYELAWMNRPLETYQPNLVHEFFASYLVLQEKDYPPGELVSDMNNLDTVPIRGVNRDISDYILNRFLFGLKYQILVQHQI